MGSSCNSNELWTIYRQTGTDVRPSGCGVHYSAGLKGDVSEESPQNWQRVKVEAQLPEILDLVEVSFVDQGGRRVGVGQKTCH